MSSALPDARRLDYHYIAMQTGFWAMFAAVCAYQAALLTARGFTNGEAGMLIAVRCLAGIVCQPALGSFADRHPGIPRRLPYVEKLLAVHRINGALRLPSYAEGGALGQRSVKMRAYLPSRLRFIFCKLL